MSDSVFSGCTERFRYIACSGTHMQHRIKCIMTVMRTAKTVTAVSSPRLLGVSAFYMVSVGNLFASYFLVCEKGKLLKEIIVVCSEFKFQPISNQIVVTHSNFSFCSFNPRSSTGVR